MRFFFIQNIHVLKIKQVGQLYLIEEHCYYMSILNNLYL
jgi:hypothetical protein